MVLLFNNELLATSFDETFATVRNVPGGAIQPLLLGMVALAMAMMMRVVGVILLIASLTIPAQLLAR